MRTRIGFNAAFARRVIISSAALCLAVVSCGGSSDEGSKPSKSGSGTPGGSDMPSAPGMMSCTSSGACDQAETEAYGTCVADTCDADYKLCFGPNYRSGKYSEVCGEYYTCLAKCGCNDSACFSACGLAPTDCQLCLSNHLTYCAQNSGCKQPSCTAGSADAGKLGTCADLAKCCAAITDATYKTLCQAEYNGAKGSGDIVCNAFVQAFQQLKACP